MRAGNLSSETAGGIGIRFEHVLYDFGKVNQPGRAFAENMVVKGLNIFLFTLNDERKSKAWCLKHNIPYTYLFECDSVLEIAEIVQAHGLLAFYDTDDRALEAITSRGRQRVHAQKWQQDYDPTR
jgi:hypothetical protein